MHVHIFNYFNPWVLSILIIWSLVWKGIALWHARVMVKLLGTWLCSL